MAHAGTLGSYRFSQGVDDIRGTTVYGADDEKIGKVDDVIFDHATMEIRYLVVDSGGWLEAGKFLIPIDQVYADAKHKDNFAVDITKQQIKSFPRYNEKSLRPGDQWKKYEDEFKKFWEESPVMHQRDSYRIITPPEEPSSAAAEASQSSNDSGIPAAEIFPERLVDKFSDPRPGGHKITLRPQGTVRRVEEAAAGVTLLKPRWDAFEEHLRSHREDIEAKCSQCTPAADKTCNVA
jgi:hypothetical protein